MDCYRLVNGINNTFMFSRILLGICIMSLYRMRICFWYAYQVTLIKIGIK